MLSIKKAPAEITLGGGQERAIFCFGVWCAWSYRDKSEYLACALGTPSSEAVVHLLIYPADKRRRKKKPAYFFNFSRTKCAKSFSLTFFWRGARKNQLTAGLGPAAESSCFQTKNSCPMEAGVSAPSTEICVIAPLCHWRSLHPSHVTSRPYMTRWNPFYVSLPCRQNRFGFFCIFFGDFLRLCASPPFCC